MLLLATLSFLPAYAFGSSGDSALKEPFSGLICLAFKEFLLALLAFGYSVYAIYGTGASCDVGFILMLAGIPVYLFIMLQNNKKIRKWIT
jgi:hypothetical protein